MRRGAKSKGLEVVNITGKEDVHREATARGRIRLKKSTISAIRDDRVPKGDVLTVSKVAAVMAVKGTPDLIPACHVIPITHVEVNHEVGVGSVTVTCKVASTSKTGVEMEALTGVCVALLTIWDMTKELEKDKRGQYPTTSIEGIRVLSKVKGH